MRICFVYKEDYPWDIRVEKIVESLIDAKHSVFLVCRNNQRRSTEEYYNGISMRRLPFLPRHFGLLNSLIGLPFFFNPLWIIRIYSCMSRDKCDIIIVRDLPLVLAGIIVGKVFGKRVIFDIAECYPNLYYSMLAFGKNKLMNFITKNYMIADFIENIALKYSNHIIVVIEESRDRLLRKGIEENKVSIVRNTPVSSKIRFTRSYVDCTIVIKFLYVGNITKIRGIDRMIEAIYHFLHDDPFVGIELHVIGTGWALQSLKEITFKLGMEKYIQFHGWCTSSVVEHYLTNCDVGILPYRVCKHWNTTIPNKLFDYMSVGMPVIAAPIIPIKRVIGETRCGIILDFENKNEFKNAIKILIDKQTRKTFGENGIQAIRSKYNWENDFQNLLNIIQN